MEFAVAVPLVVPPRALVPRVILTSLRVSARPLSLPLVIEELAGAGERGGSGAAVECAVTAALVLEPRARVFAAVGIRARATVVPPVVAQVAGVVKRAVGIRRVERALAVAAHVVNPCAFKRTAVGISACAASLPSAVSNFPCVTTIFVLKHEVGGGAIAANVRVPSAFEPAAVGVRACASTLPLVVEELVSVGATIGRVVCAHAVAARAVEPSALECAAVGVRVAACARVRQCDGTKAHASTTERTKQIEIQSCEAAELTCQVPPACR